jgi:hypothetical protein
VAEHIRANPDLEWETVMRQAEEIGCERAVKLAIFLSSELLSAEVPDSILRQLRNDQELKVVGDKICERFFRPLGNSLRIADWYSYHLGMKERFQDKIRLHVHYAYRYLRLALRPNGRDRAWVALPTTFSFLYYLVRPFRLVNERLLVSQRASEKKFAKTP